MLPHSWLGLGLRSFRLRVNHSLRQQAHRSLRRKEQSNRRLRGLHDPLLELGKPLPGLHDPLLEVGKPCVETNIIGL